MEDKTNFRNPPHHQEEVDLLNISRVLWEKRRFIYLIVGAFFLFGVFFTFLQSPSQFESKTTFLLKSSGSGSGIGSLGGLAAIAGISLPSADFSSSAEIPPSLYSKFINSIQFKKALIQAPLTIEGKTETVTYAYYYENIAQPSLMDLVKAYTIGLPDVIIGILTPKISSNAIFDEKTKLLRLTPNENAHFSRLESQLTLESKDGVMVLTFEMPDPLMAAQMADFAYQLLQKEIINYKLGNLREELRFSESLYDEKKKEFQKIQNELGFFKDRNQNVVSSSVQNQLERLQSEYSLKLNVFTQVANALESTKLQIARDTPIFSVLDPVTIPNNPEANNRLLIILLSTIFGIFAAIIYILGGEFLRAFKEKWGQV
jgi:LPS O-antigen subunit length determinant protein (WzzB/FepE family)